MSASVFLGQGEAGFLGRAAMATCPWRVVHAPHGPRASWIPWRGWGEGLGRGWLRDRGGAAAVLRWRGPFLPIDTRPRFAVFLDCCLGVARQRIRCFCKSFQINQVASVAQW